MRLIINYHKKIFFSCPLVSRGTYRNQPHSGSRDDRRKFRDDRRKRNGLFRVGMAPSALKFLPSSRKRQWPDAGITLVGGMKKIFFYDSWWLIACWGAKNVFFQFMLEIKKNKKSRKILNVPSRSSRLVYPFFQCPLRRHFLSRVAKPSFVKSKLLHT